MIGRSFALALLFLGLSADLFPAIAQELSLRFVGNQGISSVRLRGELGPWLEDLAAAPDDLGAREDLLYEIESIYRKNGFPNVMVDVGDEIGPQLENPEVRHLLIGIQEGPRAYLDDLVITGNRAIEDETLEGTFPWLRLGFLPGGRPIYTEGSRDAGVAAIRLLYSLRGYLEVRVETTVDSREVWMTREENVGPDEMPVDEIRVKMIVQVIEGPQTTLAEIEIAPGAETSDEELRGFTGVGIGSPVTPRLPVEVRSRVRRRLQDLGHYQCRVEVAMDDVAPNRKRLRLEVFEGEVFSFGSIIVSGNPRTRSAFIRDRLGVKFGDRYSATDLETGQRILNSTGLLERFTVELRPSPVDPTRLDLYVEVSERDAVRLETSVGFSTFELGRFGAGALHRNLFGWGIEGRLDGLVSFRGEEIEARLRYPYLWERDIAIELRGRYRRYEEVSFERQETLASISLQFPVDRKLSFNTGFELRDEDLTNIDPQADEIDESSRAHVIFLGGRHDNRDSAIDPTRGTLVTGRVELSDEELGSDLDFLRVTLRGSHTHPLAEGWTLVTAAQLGLIDRLDEGDIPLGERFFLGGARSVRSFREDRMAPRDEFDNEIGGEAFAVASIEVRPRLWGSLSGALFLDGGSLTENVAEFADRNWRFAGGLGLIWNSPVGPLRVDAAATLNPERGDDHWAVHVLLGQPF